MGMEANPTRDVPDPRRWWALALLCGPDRLALGVAIVTTVAVSRSDEYLAANKGADPLVALNEGFQSAFLACVFLARAAWRWPTCF